MKRKSVTFSLTPEHEQMIKEIAISKDIPYSRLIKRIIEKMYKKYTEKNNEKKEESQDDEIYTNTKG